MAFCKCATIFENYALSPLPKLIDLVEVLRESGISAMFRKKELSLCPHTFTCIPSL